MCPFPELLGHTEDLEHLYNVSNNMYFPLLQMLRRGEELEQLYTVSNNVSLPLYFRCREDERTWSNCTLLAILRTLGASDFDAQMSGMLTYSRSGNEILRPVYKNHFPKY
jgi:hypothetical protein